jgi:hypothetical protein
MPREIGPEARIRALAKQSRIGASDAARLLAAVNTTPLPPERRFDPFTRLNAVTGTLIGLGASAGAAAVSRLGVRFDGLLDVHTARAITWRQALVDQVAAFLVPAAVFWALGYALARRGRAVDMLSTVGVARLPPIVLALPLALLGSGLSRAPHLPIGEWLLVGLVLVGSAAQICLLVLGFKTATGLVGPRLVFGVAFAMILSEIASKLVTSIV